MEGTITMKIIRHLYIKEEVILNVLAFKRNCPP
jgi:hypothetical protein